MFPSTPPEVTKAHFNQPSTHQLTEGVLRVIVPGILVRFISPSRKYLFSVVLQMNFIKAKE